jgi:hypothetical protein
MLMNSHAAAGQHLPDYGSGICAESVHAVMLAGYVKHVAHRPGERHVGQIQRLGVHLAVHRKEVKVTELLVTVPAELLTIPWTAIR